MDEKKAAILGEIPRLRRYARSLLRDRDSADDLVQDCLERALAAARQLADGREPPEVAVYDHASFVHRPDAQGEPARRGRDAAAGSRRGAGRRPPSRLENVASREIIDALQAISPDRRAALVMVAIEGFSYAEAANILGVPAGTLMSRIARGREELRGLLDDTARRRAIRIVEK